ncbi:MAG: glycosyltransferase family 2 protein [Chitinophagaceae bacterium]|nr:glycosyltransferase family 2 protein [Chitinophagaceae bacterium]
MRDNWSRTAVVILCWNGRKFLEEFIPSLLQFQSADSDIVVADNASTDDSVSFLLKNYPSVKIIRLEKNYGFAEGYNQAIRKIDSEFIVMVNQDVAVTENWLPPLISIMDSDHHIGAVHPRIHARLQPEHFEYAGAAGGWIDKYGYTFCRGRVFDATEKDHNQYAHTAEVFWASGACMLVRKKVFEQLNGLDGDFFAHMEEIDFCWRLKNAGYKIMYCPDSVIYHLGGGSLPHGNPFKTYLNFRNNLVMIAKNLPEKRKRILLARILMDQLAAIRFLLSFHFSDFLAVQKAHLYFITHLQQIKKKSTASILQFSKMKGVYNGSIVWDYFVRRKKLFSEIVLETNAE